MTSSTTAVPRLWRALEAVPSLTATPVEWRGRLGADYEWAKRFLRPSGRRGSSYPCLKRPRCGCAHAVIRHADDDIVAVCRCAPRRCESIKLGAMDIVLYELNRRTFGAELAKALGAKPEGKVVDGHYLTWPIGTFEARAGFSIPLILTIQTDPEDLARIASAMAAEAEGPFVLFSPTGAFWTPDIGALFRRRKGRFLALASVLSVNGGMTINTPLKDVLAEFLEEVLPPENEQFVFRRDGATWTATFCGDARTLRDSKGLAYIAILLGNPDQDHHATQMVAAAAGQTARQAVREHMPADDSGGYKKPARNVKAVPVGAKLDDQALKEYRKKMEDIEAELKEAEGFNDSGRVSKLRQDLNLLTKEVAGAVGLRGNLRESGEQAEKNRQSVSTAIERALKVIKKEHPNMWGHLDQAVKRGQFLAYRPGQRMPWVL